MKSSEDISAEPVGGQKIEGHVVTDLYLRNDENKPSLTSGATAEERQEVSSKNTTDELSDSFTGSKDMVSGHPIYRKKFRNIGWNTKSYF